MAGISFWQLLIIAVIVILLFGTKKLRNLGGDIGSAVKGFKNAMSEDKETPSESLDDKRDLKNNKVSEKSSEPVDKDKV